MLNFKFDKKYLIIILIILAIIIGTIAIIRCVNSGSKCPPPSCPPCVYPGSKCPCPCPPSPPSPTPPSPTPPSPGSNLQIPTTNVTDNQLSFDMFFPPYECPTEYQTNIDIGMLDAIIASAQKYISKNGKLPGNDENNPYQIKYCVYNLYDDGYVERLIEAFNLGIYVQVLIDYDEVKTKPKPKQYNFTISILTKARFNIIQDVKGVTQSQRDIINKGKVKNLDKLNLIPIDIGKLMHCKTRYYKFGDVTSVNVGKGITKSIKECIVTGSFNPECAATNNNEFLLVLSSSNNTTPDIIKNYLRIYNYVRQDGTDSDKPLLPPKGDPIYNLDNAINVVYSRWCKNAGDNYMRYKLLEFIKNENEAILLPLYSLSNLDSPDMYTDKSSSITFDNSSRKIIYDDSNQDFPKLTNLNEKTLKIIKSWGVKGIGCRVDIDYQHTTKSSKTETSTYTTYIRGDEPGITVNDDELILVSRYSSSFDKNKITKITFYKTLLSHYGDAIDKRNVKIILLINKSQLDGEIASDGTSFTGGDSSLTAYLMSKMGAILYRCSNPDGELHSKNGYFYSQNILITDTTNWSNAGMGSQGKTQPSCSINAETCLIVNGNKFKGTNINPDIFRIKVLANFVNTIRMYEYQQYCPYDPTILKFWRINKKPLNNPNYMNCTCPDLGSNDPVTCELPKPTLLSSSKNPNLAGHCNFKFSEINIGDTTFKKQQDGSNCFVEKPRTGDPVDCSYGSCVVDCCLRHNQIQANPHKISYDNILGSILSKLTDWPHFTSKTYGITSPVPVGTVKKIGDKYIIIDPTFDWGSGTPINDVDFYKSIKSGDITKITESDNKVGIFCKEDNVCHKKYTPPK